MTPKSITIDFLNHIIFDLNSTNHTIGVAKHILDNLVLREDATEMYIICEFTKINIGFPDLAAKGIVAHILDEIKKRWVILLGDKEEVFTKVFGDQLDQHF